MNEGALDRVNGDFFKIVNREVKGPHGDLKLLGHAGVAHEAVIGIDGDAEAGIKEDAEGVFLQGGSGSGVHVAEEAALKGDALIENKLGECSHGDDLAIDDGHVFEETGGMPEAVSAAVLEGLPDGFDAKGFSGMDGDIEVGAACGIEGFEMALGGVAVFTTGEVEPDHSVISKIDGEFGGLKGVGSVTHRANDESPADTVLLFATTESRKDGADDGILGQSLLGMEDGREAHFGVDDAIAVHVFDELEGDALECFAGLHDGDGVGEAFEVLGKAALVGTAMEPGAESLGISRGEVLIAGIAGQIDDGGGSESAIEVLVKEDLGEGTHVDAGQKCVPRFVNYWGE